jgi:predicted DNA-binding transcriptional regulator AlpA
MDGLKDLLSWLEGLPEGTLLSPEGLLDKLRAQDIDRASHQGDGSSCLSSAPAADPPTWCEKLWTVPAETRLGVAEVSEALGRSKAWIYHHTAEKATSRIPHRKLDGSLVFLAGEVREWQADSEEVIEPAVVPFRQRLKVSGA